MVERLLPSALRASPGTGLLVLIISLSFIFQTVVGGPDRVFSFTTYSLQQLGSNFAPRIVLGEYWRFVTGMFSHGGLLHVAFNLYGLTIVGPLVEELLDRKKMWFVAVISGVFSMVASYVWGAEIMGRPLHMTVGASGAVTGLIGAAWFGARRLGPNGAQVAAVMKRWTVYMAIFGFVVSGIDNAAHFGGFVVGALFGHLIPLGLTQSVRTNRVLSGMMLGGLAGIALCFVFMVDGLRGFPGQLEDDWEPQTFLFFRISSGAPPEQSSQRRATRRCIDAARENAEDALEACQFAVRAAPSFPANWVGLQAAYLATGEQEKADRIQRVLDGFPRR